jgi:hypothetical protein
MKQKIFRERQGDVDGIVPGIFLGGISRTFELCDSSQPPCIRIRLDREYRFTCVPVATVASGMRIRSDNQRGERAGTWKGTRTEREFAFNRFKCEPKFREFS